LSPHRRALGPQEKTTVIRTVLADDEVLARRKLVEILRDEPGIEIVGEGATAFDTIDLIRATAPDLLFLDIRMPGMDGFEIVGEVSSIPEARLPSIIFTAAYDCYALRVFEINAVDYLLKPFTPGRAHTSVQRARGRILIAQRTSGRDNNHRRDGTLYLVQHAYHLQISWTHPLSLCVRYPLD
jgi:two-component system, LytTR family, response regulator